MPHQCIRCSALYGDEQMVMMCGCGSNAFLFIRPECAGTSADDADGKYEIDLAAMLKGEVIQEHEEGKYTINLAQGLRKRK